MCFQIDICSFTCTNISLYAYIHTYTHIHTYIYIYIFIHTYVPLDLHNLFPQCMGSLCMLCAQLVQRAEGIWQYSIIWKSTIFPDTAGRRHDETDERNIVWCSHCCVQLARAGTLLCFGVSPPGERHYGRWSLRFKKCQYIGTPEGLIELQSCCGTL